MVTSTGRARVLLAALVLGTLPVAACSTPSTPSTPQGGASTTTVGTATATGRPGGGASAATARTAQGGGTSATAATTSAPVAGTASAPVPVPVSKLLVFVVENHSLAQMQAQMPFTYRLATSYGYASSYFGIRHPSLPNYLAIASGGTHGVTTDAAPAESPIRGPSVFGRAIRAGLMAAVYADGMSRNCAQASGGRYAVKHNPWPYFAQEPTLCRQHDLPISALGPAVGAGRLPNAGMVVPDLCHDAHDCTLATADSWFAAWMTRIEAGPDWRSGRLAVVLTADEDDTSAGNRVLTVVAHPSQHHRVVTARLDHYSLTRLYAEVTGTEPLGQGATARSMAVAFGLPLP